MRNPFDTPEREAFRDTVRSFVARDITPFADGWDEAGEIPWELHQKVAELGVFGFGIPEEHGGLGFDDAFMRAIWAVELAACGAGGVGAALGGRTISIDPIVKFASPEIRDRVVPEIVSGRKGSSLGITEPGGGSDVANLKTSARKDGNGWRISGSKTFITGGMTSDYFVIGARTGGEGMGGVSLFFIEWGAEGFTRTALERKMGWWCSDQATLYFDDVFVPADAMIGPENAGFMVVMNNFNLERLGLIAGSLGMAKVCLEDSIAWAKERVTFGKPLIRHQVIRHKIADMSARIDALEAYTNQICWQINEGDMPVAELSKAKFFATKTLEHVASEAMQILGGAGYLRGNRIERIYREVKVMAIGGGSEEIMKDLAVRQMGL
ncbi:acyl-CoA dehydrogenase family protein [Parvularcula lutaonensis]|uniref:Acyl-CoA dehydrogenase family protein n=1 Tax=Parvularcula lutaonensis TaxID=491923 RepID=A0ABV7MCH8_9PROT|nr:acyl-CoA dehydrogenase family protein [Parvularcula lutaonensis]GGY38102.1 acyl-CoA dehydrogenase [Parvularcula lutaonensis]